MPDFGGQQHKQRQRHGGPGGPDATDLGGFEAQFDRSRPQRPRTAGDPNQISFEAVDRGTEWLIRAALTLFWNIAPVAAPLINILFGLSGIYVPINGLGVMGVVIGILGSCFMIGMQMYFYREASEFYHAVRKHKQLPREGTARVVAFGLFWVFDNLFVIMGYIYVTSGFDIEKANSFDFSGFNMGTLIGFFLIMMCGLSAETLMMNRLKRGGLRR